MTEKRLGNMPRFIKKIGLNYWTQEITGCRRHRISLLLAGMRNAWRVCSWAKLKDKVSGKEVLFLQRSF